MLTEPSTTLVRLLTLLPRGRVLDVACGEGRNAVFLAGNGFTVDAVDSSPSAIEEGKRIAEEAGAEVNFILADINGYVISPDTYDLIINFNFLERRLAPQIIRGLKSGGALLFETFAIEQRKIGRPKNPDYLLGPNELLRLFGVLHIAYYREGTFTEGGRKKAGATLLGIKKTQDSGNGLEPLFS